MTQRLRGRAISPKGPGLLTRNAAVIGTSAGPDRSEIQPYLGKSLGYIPESCYKPNVALQGSCHKLNLTSASPRWGDFSESATSADMDYRSDRNAAEPDRSEIGPYLGGHWAASRSPATNPTSTHLKGGILNAAKGGKNNCRRTLGR
jgi:hypothetical protein